MNRNSRNVFILIGAVLILNGCSSQPSNPKPQPEDLAKIADLNTRLAIAYMRDNENELASKKLEKALDADPNHAPAYNVYGLLYNRVGEFEKADDNFRKAIKIDGTNSSILNNYGQVLCQNGHYEKGQEMFLKANENPLYRTPEIAFSNAGTCALDANDLETAESHLRKALAINQRLNPALLQMSIVSYRLKRYLPARAYLQRYLEVGKHTAQSLWLGIRIERELGDKDTLASYALQLENSFPDSQETRLLLESRGQ